MYQFQNRYLLRYLFYSLNIACGLQGATVTENVAHRRWQSVGSVPDEF